MSAAALVMDRPAGSAPAPASASLLHKTAWSALASASTVLGRFLVTVVVARRLGPSGAGRLAYLLFILESVGILTGFGLQSCVTRFVADLRGQNRASMAPELARWLYLPFLALSVVGAAGIAAVAIRPGTGLEGASDWLCLGACLLTQALGSFYLAYLAGQQRFNQLARLNLISNTALVLVAGAGIFFFGVKGALAGYAAGSALPAVLSVGLLGRRQEERRLDRALLARCLKYALFSWCAAIVSAFVWSRIEIAFLERFWGAHTVAMFSIGLTLSGLAVQGPLLFGGALMPHFAEAAGAGIVADRRVYGAGTRLLSMFLFPLCLGLSSIVPVLLPAIYGEAFRPAVPTAMVLTAFSAIAFVNVGAALVYASGKAWFVAASGLAGAALSVAGCLLAVPAWGPWGAALSRCTVQTAMMAAGIWFIATRLGCPTPLRSLGKLLGSAIVSAFASYLLISAAPSVGTLPFAILLAGAVYATMLRITRAVEPEDAAALRRALNGLPAAVSSPLTLILGWLAV